MTISLYLKNNTYWVRPVLKFIVAALLITTLARVCLVLWLWDRVTITGGLSFIFLQGLRFDMVSLGLLIGLPVAITPLVLTMRPLARPWTITLSIFFQIVLVLLVFLELATPTFIAEYDIRPNRLFIEYLNHPREVMSMLWGAFKLPMLFTATGILLVASLSWRYLRLSITHSRTVSVPMALILAPLVLVIAVAAVRSTLDHRAVNPSTVAFSSDPLINTLPLNSTYSVLYALYELQHEDTDYAYDRVDEQHVLSRVRASMNVADSEFNNSEIPTLHWQQATYQFERPKNLVIVIEESLGAEHVGRMGGTPVTPNLDRLSREGIWFENLYATGTRSVRGLEAIVTGFPPTTSRSVVKLSKSQRNFFTMGSLLKEAGYDTSFIYGGESQFDNMRRFFANNGFDHIIDKHNIENPVFTGSWGASDEDVFNAAHNRYLGLSKGSPFFSVVFTTSNHTPYDFPEGRITPYDTPMQSVNNAIKYADHALGEFIDKAKSSEYWNNTVFLIIADHNSRVYGAELVPIERFHIPGLILGGGIRAKQIDRIASQIDMLPTLLSMIGVSTFHPAIGLDLTSELTEKLPGRAVMQFDQNQAYMEENRVVVLRPGKDPQQYLNGGGHLTESKNDPDLIDVATSLATWPWLAYSKEQYRTPGTTEAGYVTELTLTGR